MFTRRPSSIISVVPHDINTFAFIIRIFNNKTQIYPRLSPGSALCYKFTISLRFQLLIQLINLIQFNFHNTILIILIWGILMMDYEDVKFKKNHIAVDTVQSLN